MSTVSNWGNPPKLQVVNLRGNTPRNIQGEDALLRYEQEAAAMRIKMEAAGVRFAVGPSQGLALSDGRVLKAGDPVDVSMFPSGQDVPPWRRIELLVLNGVCIESDYDDGPQVA